ncbi:MAG TPA: alpha-amylase family glycosyl hydrolase, partial [Candidatus Binataceae bacterium]|nr:alpha-amylase family glycosyl hydrolase [Candidatus Binataceae bacterium]
MSDSNWWRDAIFYQIYPRSFADSNGDGIGDLDGIGSHLDYLNDGTSRSLGIDALWLSPINPSPLRDWGYDVSDYCGVHPDLGDLASFDRLLAEAHRRGIRMILDLVPNHTSDQHPWFRESRASRSNPKRDWYIWRAGRGDAPPNNWKSTFGGPAWQRDAATGEWYMHSFLVEQPDLNYRNPEVVRAMHDVLRFWLDRGVDGFRIDVIANLMKD